MRKTKKAIERTPQVGRASRQRDCRNGSDKVDEPYEAHVTWAYGVRTVLQKDRVRLRQYLPRTLDSLYTAGFPNPWIFADGAKDPFYYEMFGRPLTTRWPAVGVTGNFLLSLWELAIRCPGADRYALFEDDILLCRNLRQYLSQLRYRPKSYWNLFACPYYHEARPLWRKRRGSSGLYKPPQKGKGALALVFDREAVLVLLSNRWLSDRLLAAPGADALDGLIVTAMQQAGCREWTHSPSLVQHTGEVSSFGNGPHLPADSFPGEEFDALNLVQ